MKKLLAVLFFLVVNVLNVSAVNAAQMVRVSDLTLEQYLHQIRNISSVEIYSSVASLNFSDPIRYTENDIESMQLKCWVSTISSNSKIVGGIFFIVDNKNIVSALKIGLLDQENQLKNGKIFTALMHSVLYPLNLSSSEISSVISWGIFAEEPIWCERTQQFMYVQMSETGMITITAWVE